MRQIKLFQMWVLICSVFFAGNAAISAPLQQNATASGCGVALNIGSNARVTVNNHCNEDIAKIVQGLLDKEKGIQDAKIEKIQQIVDALTIAVKHLLPLAERVDATAAQKRVAQLLRKGKRKEAIAELNHVIKAAQALAARESQRADIAKTNAASATAVAGRFQYDKALLLVASDVNTALSEMEKAVAALPNDMPALTKAGEFALTAGNTNKASRYYHLLQAEAQNRLATGEDREYCECNLINSFNGLGDVQSTRGDTAGALQSFRASLAIAQKLAAQDPGNSRWQRDLSISHDRIGDMQQAQGDGAGALQSFRAALAIAQKLAAQDPGNSQWQRDLSISHERIGDMQQAQGDGAGALQSFRAALAIRQKLAAQDPGNSQWQRDLSISHNKIGDMQQAQGDGAGALQSFRAALAIAQKLAAQDPGNSQWQRDLSISHNKIGDMQQAQGDGAGALQSFRADLAIAQKLVTQDPGNALWQVDLAKSKLKVFTVETDTALRGKLLLEAIATLRELRAANRLDAADRTMLEKLEAFLQKTATP